MRAIAVLSVVLLASACGAGNAETRQAAQRAFQVGAFDRIVLSGSPDVVVAVGGPLSVRAEGDAETLERLEILAENGELRIGLREGSARWFSFGHHRVTVHVTMPSLTGAAIRGSGDIRIDRVEGPRFAAAVTGSGDIDIGTLAVGAASFSITGSGGITAAGRVQRSVLAVTGSGDLDLSRVEAETADVALAGSGDVGIRATRTAAVELRGSGDVTIAGPARCTVSKSGSGDVTCGV
jgi:hypothetical protein